MFSRAVAVFVVLLAVAVPAAAEHPANGAGPVTAAIAARLDGDGPLRLGAQDGTGGVAALTGLAPVTVDGEAQALRTLYRDGGFEPIWLAGPEAEARFAAVLDLLRRSDRDGLSPNDYFVVELAALADRKTPASVAERDLLTSAAVMRYARDIQAGRLEPSRLPVEAEIDYDRRAIDKVATVRAAAAADDPSAWLETLAPDHEMYRALRAALVEARKSVAAGGWPEVPAGPTLHPGDRSDRVPDLRARLQASGDYRPGAVPNVAEMPDTAAEPTEPRALADSGDSIPPTTDSEAVDPTLYDAALVAGVEDFQRRHGLLVDGVVGPRTLAALNVTAEERVGQVIASMERWRWLPPDLGDRYVLVNIPEYRLHLYEGDEIVREMDVIVGRASRPTPLFSSALTWLEWNPTWTVPVSIAEKDYLPHLIEDPSYLARKNMYVYADWQPNAPVIDPEGVDWAEIGRGIRTFMLRQEPGPGNALGKVKFMMSNNFSVYLHDTPERHLFARTHRAYSSGCVRVQDPLWFADYLMAGAAGWDGAENEPVMSHWRTTRMNMPEGMPLHLAYITVMEGEDGRTMFFEDIYGLDAAIMVALAEHRPDRTQVALAD